MRIGIDLMGSDCSPHLLFSAVVQAAEKLDSSHILLVIATETVINGLSCLINLRENANSTALIEFHVVADFISMTDDPLEAIRRKKQSSLVVGISLLKKAYIDAFVSCGNTGALIASATLLLKTLPGIQRPALLAVLPTELGIVAVLDVGGNVSCKTSHLFQFAHLGVAYQRAIRGIENPTVGLLNVGEESKKGTIEVRQAYEFLRNQCQELAAKGISPRMHFIGNIEGRDIFKGLVDVVVTDGFTGNILLKTAEGVASYIFDSLSRTIKNHSLNSFVSDLDRTTISELKLSIDELQRHFNYAEYPGAILCGINGIVVKVHGNGSPKALYSSIFGAIECVRKKIISSIKEHLR